MKEDANATPSEEPWRLFGSDEGLDEKRFQRIQRVNEPDRRRYEPTEQIIAAVDTAVSLGKPLLVSGEPGVGKTQLAYYIALRFGLFEKDNETPEVLRFDIKSTTKGSDLIYRYDAIRQFRDVQLTRAVPDAEPKKISYESYIELDALGTAIALANGPREYANADLNGIVASAIGQRPNTSAPRVSVVLIDEIDKAPRDVPNDLLREIEDMTGSIPELGPNVGLPKPDFQFRPIVVITTNDERALPDAFLRRCCFLHIPFPGSDPETGGELKAIIQTRLGSTWSESSLAGAAIRLTYELREERARLSKKPTTAELIDFILELRSLGIPPRFDFLKDVDDSARSKAISAAITVFAKDEQDKTRVRDAFSQPKK